MQKISMENGVKISENKQKEAALFLREKYGSEILDLVITNVEVDRQNIKDFRLICASLDPCLILNSTAKDPNLSKGTFTFIKEGYLVTFNGNIGNKSSLSNPDLEQDDDVHGRILDGDENNVTHTKTLNVQISDDTCVPLKFAENTYKMIYDGAHQCYGYRKKDTLRCKNRRRIDVNNNAVFCHHHISQRDDYTKFKSGDTSVDFVPEHWKDLKK